MGKFSLNSAAPLKSQFGPKVESYFNIQDYLKEPTTKKKLLEELREDDEKMSK